MYTSRLLDLACAIQQIPAPTFEEEARAQFVLAQFQAHQLSDISIDDLGNVYARRPGTANGPALLVTAHTDTVFPREINLALTRTEERIIGPGIGDNSLGVAGLFGLLWSLEGVSLPGDLYLVANVGEEGMGDLRGMRQVMARFGPQVAATIVLEGMALGRVVHGGIGVRRYRFSTHTDGGHSYQHFGKPSAIHALVKFGAELAALRVTTTPKTTFNIGMIGGGTSINTIAREAWLDLDLRSEDAHQLTDLVAQVEHIAAHYHTAEVRLEQHLIGNRPAGELAREHPLVQAAAKALNDVGLTPIYERGSTDANIPLSLGYPAVCVGLTYGNNAHRPDEYIETKPLEKGLLALTELVKYAFGH
jgi:acetylornithine deacetylase/succinyl-diaminopimelate desuccinylase-like protein